MLGEPRIGHTGTLDPAASGVLPLVLGRATRLARFLSASDKSYEAVIRVGVATDTYDGEGTPVGPAYGGPCPSREAIEAALGAFRGSFLQQPPAYSAKKIAGRRSYKIARAKARDGSGREGARDLPDPVRVMVHRLDLVGLDGDSLTLRIDCSAGFYVRALAHDFGQRLGSGAHLAALRRTSSGDFTLADALSFEAAERDHDPHPGLAGRDETRGDAIREGPSERKRKRDAGARRVHAVAGQLGSAWERTSRIFFMSSQTSFFLSGLRSR